MTLPKRQFTVPHETGHWKGGLAEWTEGDTAYRRKSIALA
jgi:hypothetical protein